MCHVCIVQLVLSNLNTHQMMDNNTEAIANESNLIVCVRIRPMSSAELNANAEKVCHRVDDKLISVVAPKNYGEFRNRGKKDHNRTYIFDRAFDESCSQEEVFEQTTSKLVEHVANGFNATVFASGATGAGKTHTMVGTDSDPGIMVRAMEKLFSYMSTTSEDYKYQIKMAYMELYNELLRDLLMPGPEYLELREDPRGIRVVGLHEVEPADRNEVFHLLHHGNMNRTTEPTAANKTSSRSHAILQITVHQLHRVRAIHEEQRVGKLFLVDLAGSERASKTLNRGKRMKEGAHINRSLLALGNCINALADSGNRRYVNYRDSKLTRLLKDALAGNCKTVMIAHLSPSSWHFEETCNTLVYADRAKGIKTKIRRNVLDVNHHISEYTRLIDELREEIVRLKSDSQPKQVDDQKFHAENDKLKDQLIDAQQEHLKIRYQLARVKNQLRELDGDETTSGSIHEEWPCSTASSTSLTGRTDNQKLSDDILNKHVNASCLSQQDLSTLQHEKSRLEASRKTLERSQDVAQNRVHTLQRSLAERHMTKEEREVIHLLCRLHEVELERADLSGRLVSNETEISHTIPEQNNSHLSEAIIRYQANLLANHHVQTPKELEQLLELYEQKPNFRRSRRMSVGSSLNDISLPSHWVPDIFLFREQGTSPEATGGNLDVTSPNETRLLEKWHSRRASDADTRIPHDNLINTRVQTPSMLHNDGFRNGEPLNGASQAQKKQSEHRGNYVGTQKHTPLINRPTPPRKISQLRPSSLENVRPMAPKINQRTRSSKPVTDRLKSQNRKNGLRNSALSKSSQAIPSCDRLTPVDLARNSPRRPYESEGQNVSEQRKQSLRRLNFHLSRPSQEWSRLNTPNTQRMSLVRDWADGPLTRPIKIVPMEIKTSRRAVPERTSHPSSSRSRIPRSKSSPIQLEDDIDSPLPVDNIESLKPIKEARKFSIGNGARRLSSDMPLQQTSAVFRSNQTIADQRRK